MACCAACMDGSCCAFAVCVKTRTAMSPLTTVGWKYFMEFFMALPLEVILRCAIETLSVSAKRRTDRRPETKEWCRDLDAEGERPALRGDRRGPAREDVLASGVYREKTVTVSTGEV